MIHKRIIIAGKTASGKSYMRKKLEQRGYKYGISYTTRKMRPKEINGQDYHFISEELFIEMIKNDQFYEYVSFNDCYYGTSRETFNRCELFIMTPHGIENIKLVDRENCLIFFLDTPEEKRKERLLKRNDKNIEKRILADEKDFEYFKDFDIRITTENF